MAFQEFTEINKKRSHFVSISSHQAINFGGDWLEQNNLADKKFVKLFFNFEQETGKYQIGFRFVDENSEGTAFKLIINKGTESKAIVARSFFLKYLNDLNIDEFEKRYKPQKIEDQNFGSLWIITLKKKQV